jgi:DNA-binding CsgD family transcriptional regulator
MAEIVAALHGSGAALTLHPSGRPAELIYADPGRGLEDLIAALLQAQALDWQQEHEDHHVWLSGNFGRHAPHAIVLPVRQVPSHSRLVITVFFDTLDEERRAAAEAAYLQRRPFAVGYFRLWQQERLHRRDVDALRSALDRVDVAVMMIAKSGALSFANEAARKLLNAGTGIHERQGKLQAASRTDNVTLGVLIAHVIGASEHLDTLDKVPLLTIAREGSSPLIVAVLPAPHPVSEEGEIAALVLAVDPDMDIADFARPVCRAFGLTRVESDLACRLASGQSVQDAADAMHVKLETARTYLRSIFSKTGTNRQVDLVRLILVSLVRASDPREFEAI